MSDIHEELLGRGVNKKRIVGVFIIAGILLSFFTWQTLLYSTLLGSQRINPNEETSNADYKDRINMLPPLPMDLQDLLDLLGDLTAEQIQDLMDMFDGDVGDYDLGDYTSLLIAALFSEVEVFKVYDYDSIDDMSDILWKQECYDEYDGESWTSTEEKSQTFFTNISLFDDVHKALGADEYLLKMTSGLKSNDGANSLTIFSLFPDPYIVAGSVDSNSSSFNKDSVFLFKDDLNCTSLLLDFDGVHNFNLKYRLWGKPGLPTPQELNNTAVNANYTPSAIKDQFIQLPLGISGYKADRDNFRGHCDVLETIINPDDNAWTVVNKILTYLQNNFTFGYSKWIGDEGPEDGEDEIEWFCEEEEGISTHFASAFSAFCRIFGVASRFVSGFNSKGVNSTEAYDSDENLDGFSVKFKNMYNWAEVYIPTDEGTGEGHWVEIDVLDGYPTAPPSYTLNVSTDSTVYNRTSSVNITAIIDSDSPNAVIENVPIVIQDITNNTNIGTFYTDSNGIVSTSYLVDNSLFVGPHTIRVSFQGTLENTTQFIVNGSIDVNLTSVSPQFLNRSITNDTTVQGYIFDPVNNARIENAQLDISNFLLFKKGNNTPQTNPFTPTPSSVTTDANGQFSIDLRVNDQIPIGKYEIRVDFNGTWTDNTTSYIKASSNRMDLNITKYQEKKISFYINNFRSNEYYQPSVSRYSNLQLKVKVTDMGGSPIQFETVAFRHLIDYNNWTIIGYNTTNINGIATYTYNVPYESLAGPNLLRVSVGPENNYSYYILNETPSINIISGPTPAQINITDSGTGSDDTQFNVTGTLTDPTNNKPLNFTRIKLELWKDGQDKSNYLNPSSNTYDISADGAFNFTFEVNPGTPQGDYSIRIIFNGTFIYTNFAIFKNPHLFNIVSLSNISILPTNLSIQDPDNFIFNFHINDIPNDNFNNPVIYRNNPVNLSVEVQWGTDLIKDGEMVNFTDITQNDYLIGSVPLSNGRASIIYNTDGNTVAGPHLIQVKIQKGIQIAYNYSYFILNSNVSVNIETGPSPSTINCTGIYGREFFIKGQVRDTLNHNPLNYSRIYVYLFDGPTDVTTTYLVKTYGSYYLNGSGEFFLVYRVADLTPEKNYTIRINFNGTVIYDSPNTDYLSSYDFDSRYEHTFNLVPISVGNFSDTKFLNLKVINSENISLIVKLEGNYTSLTYYEPSYPQRYSRGEMMTFDIWVNETGKAQIGDIARIFDIYNYTELDSHAFTALDNGHHTFIINTNSPYLHSGLHLINITYERAGQVFATHNKTYIVINESLNINPSNTYYQIQRNVNSVSINGYVSDNGNFLSGMNVSIQIFDENMIHKESSFNIVSNNFYTTGTGYFSFFISSAKLSCLQGLYYARIDFNGSVNTPEVVFSNYMRGSSSSLITINVSASTSIINRGNHTLYESFFPLKWQNGDILYVYGNLTWDNGTGISFANINIVIYNVSLGIVVNVTDATDSSGVFNVTINIDTPYWDYYREDSDIFVTFDPVKTYGIPEGYYIQQSQAQYL